MRTVIESQSTRARIDNLNSTELRERHRREQGFPDDYWPIPMAGLLCPFKGSCKCSKCPSTATDAIAANGKAEVLS